MPLTFRDLTEGMVAKRSVLIGDDQVSSFVALTADNAPVHTDRDHARSLGYEGRIAHGMLVGSMYSQILGCELPGVNAVIMKLSLDMVKPVLIGDTVQYSVAVSRLSEATRSATMTLSAHNAAGEQVNRGTAVCIFRGPISETN
jgi:3-hydroxybutyryl-CoA dehydratase